MSPRSYISTLSVVLVLSSCTALGACSSSGSDHSSVDTSVSSSPSVVVPELPQVAELNAVFARAFDESLPIEQRVAAVEGGQEAPELFAALGQAKKENSVSFEVVDPVLPGLTPGSAQATVNITIPEQEPISVSGAEFYEHQGQWQLSQEWSCMMVRNVAPDQVAPQCSQDKKDKKEVEDGAAPQSSVTAQ